MVEHEHFVGAEQKCIREREENSEVTKLQDTPTLPKYSSTWGQRGVALTARTSSPFKSPWPASIDDVSPGNYTDEKGIEWIVSVCICGSATDLDALIGHLTSGARVAAVRRVSVAEDDGFWVQWLHSLQSGEDLNLQPDHNELEPAERLPTIGERVLIEQDIWSAFVCGVVEQVTEINPTMCRIALRGLGEGVAFLENVSFVRGVMS